VLTLSRSPEAALEWFARYCAKLGEQAMIPGSILEGLERYTKFHRHPGGFLVAVLANDLLCAVQKASKGNRELLAEIVEYVERSVTTEARGSYERVQTWLENN